MWADRAGGASSLHVHYHRSNLFLLSEGRILVAVECTDGTIQNHYLLPGRALNVAAGIRHRLVVLEPMDGIELYLASPGQTLDPGDIHRFDEGWAPGAGGNSAER